ncbi:Endoglucanase 24 [Forsythia ovata]|uniref:cellulase n=1 Tax=Forsythia ovata TaxID=205694 RepID=A0ABD1SLS6_9LAMI
MPGVIFAQVGDADADHNCWQRPEDMDTPRTAFAVSEKALGSEVSAEIATALAAASMVFKAFGDRGYAILLYQRASKWIYFSIALVVGLTDFTDSMRIFGYYLRVEA